MHPFYSKELPGRFKRNIEGLHGEKGAKWLSDLPNQVAEIAGKWSLEVEKPFSNLSFHYVAPCACADGKKAVLKIGFTEENSIIHSEAKILKLLNGKGAVKLLNFDKNFCAILLERLLPGENLIEICQRDDEKATAIAIEVMKKFWVSSSDFEEFSTLENWIKGLSKAKNTLFPRHFSEKAEKYFADLIASSKRTFLLHGDLHHENILSAQREPFLAIDPKGIVGDIGFEISVFLNNPRSWILTHPDRHKILKKRIEMFSENFEIEPQNLKKWAFAEAVLAAWWTFEDNGPDVEKWLSCAVLWESVEV